MLGPDEILVVIPSKAITSWYPFLKVRGFYTYHHHHHHQTTQDEIANLVLFHITYFSLLNSSIFSFLETMTEGIHTLSISPSPSPSPPPRTLSLSLSHSTKLCSVPPPPNPLSFLLPCWNFCLFCYTILAAPQSIKWWLYSDILYFQCCW